MKNEELDKVANMLGSLLPHVEKIQQISPTTHGIFRSAVRLAIVKTYQFSLAVTKKYDEPFFLMPTLRGICEDLIVLSFLSNLANKDEVVEILHSLGIADGVEHQIPFFTTVRPEQPVVKFNKKHKDHLTQRMRKIAVANGWGKKRDRLPTCYKMAEECGLLPLYDFLYAATSKFVHFSPNVLFRMGWAELEKSQKETGETEYVSSTQHFKYYYSSFNRIYSLYLLVLLLRKFIVEFDEKVVVSEILTEINVEIRKVNRWPEIVTFEELNIPLPKTSDNISPLAAALLGHYDPRDSIPPTK